MENLQWWAYLLCCVGAFCFLLSLNFAVKKFNEFRFDTKLRSLQHKSSEKSSKTKTEVCAVQISKNPEEFMGNQNKPLPSAKPQQPPGISFVFSMEENSEIDTTEPKGIIGTEIDENEEMSNNVTTSTTRENETDIINNNMSTVEETHSSSAIITIEDQSKSEIKLEIVNSFQNQNVDGELLSQKSGHNNRNDNEFTSKSNTDFETKNNELYQPTKSVTLKIKSNDNIKGCDINDEVLNLKNVDSSTVIDKKESHTNAENQSKAMNDLLQKEDIIKQMPMCMEIIKKSNSDFSFNFNKTCNHSEVKNNKNRSDTNINYSSHIIKSEITITRKPNKKVTIIQTEDQSKTSKEKETFNSQVYEDGKYELTTENSIDCKTKEEDKHKLDTSVIVEPLKNNINTEVSKVKGVGSLSYDRLLNNKIEDQSKTEMKCQKVYNPIVLPIRFRNSDGNIRYSSEFPKRNEKKIEAKRSSHDQSNHKISSNSKETSLTKDLKCKCLSSKSAHSIFSNPSVLKTDEQELEFLKGVISFSRETLKKTAMDIGIHKDRIEQHSNEIHNKPPDLSLELKNSKIKHSVVDAASKNLLDRFITLSKETEEESSVANISDTTQEASIQDLSNSVLSSKNLR